MKSDLFEALSLKECCDILNQSLVQNGSMGSLLEVGKLKDVSEEFELSNIVLKSEFKIQLRFLNFREAYAAYNALMRVNIKTDSDPFHVSEEMTDLDKRYIELRQQISES